MSRPSSARTCSITTTCCSTGRRWSAEPRSRPTLGGRFDHVLVDEYQDTNRLQASILLALKPDGQRPHRRRRRRPVDLFVPRRDGAQHPRLPRRSSARRPTIVTLDRNYRSTQPILAAANAVIELAAERFTKNLWTERAVGRAAAARHRARRGRPGPLRRRAACWRTARPALRLKQQAVLFRDLAPQRAARGRADPPQHPLREIRRPEVPRRRARQGPARAAALRRRTRATASPASACCSSCPASARPRRSACSIACTDAADPIGALIEVAGPAAGGR